MSFIYSNPWTDAAAYGQAMGNTLAQSLVQIPAIRAQMAMQQAQLARQGQQDAWEARRMNWEADEQKRRETAFGNEQKARNLNIEAAQQALAQGQQRQAIVSQIPGKMYSGPMADPANKDSLMNLVQQLAIMQNPAGVWQQMAKPAEEYTLGPEEIRLRGDKEIARGLGRDDRITRAITGDSSLDSTLWNIWEKATKNEYGERIPNEQLPPMVQGLGRILEGGMSGYSKEGQVPSLFPPTATSINPNPTPRQGIATRVGDFIVTQPGENAETNRIEPILNYGPPQAEKTLDYGPPMPPVASFSSAFNMGGGIPITEGWSIMRFLPKTSAAYRGAKKQRKEQLQAVLFDPNLTQEQRVQVQRELSSLGD